MVLPFARLESQVSQGALGPRDQQVLRVLPVLEDPRDHEEIKVKQANKEVKGPQAPRDLQGHWDLTGPEAQRVQKEPKVTQVLKEAKALLDPRDLQGHWEVTGNSAFLKIGTKKRTLD